MKQVNVFIAGLLLLTVQLFAQEKKDTLSKTDFVRRNKTIFFDDFSKLQTGDLPIQWSTNSSGYIVTTANYPGKWFQLNNGGYFIPSIKEKLSDHFTIEFDLVPLNSNYKTPFSGMNFQIIAGNLSNPFEEKSTPGMAGIGVACDLEHLTWANWSETDEGFKENGSVAFTFHSGEKYQVSIWVQKQSLRMYVNNRKILDLPEGLTEGYNYNIFRIQTNEEIKPLIGNFSVATSLIN